LGFGAYFREKGLILEIGTYRKHFGLGHSIGAVLLGFGAYFREKGLILEIGTYRKHFGLGRATHV
jgi:hypothetical protein